MKIKPGDEVLVLQGKDAGRKGKVEKVFPKKRKALVAGVNIYKKHVKKSSKIPAGVIEVTKPLFIANLALVCPACNLATRVGFSFTGGQKVRICKKCKQQV